MVALSLKDALKDEDTLLQLQNHPESFRFRDEVSLVVATKHAPPSVIIKEEDAEGGFTATGPLPNFIEALAMSMNFTYKLVQAPDKAWGAQTENGSWTGLVGMMTREDADVAVATVCRSATRSQVVDYSWPVVVTSGKLLAVRDSPEIDPWGFVMPLAPMVWLGLFLSLLGACALIILMERKASETSWNYIAIWGLFGYIRAALNQGITLDTGHLPVRSLVGAWICLVAILTWSYNCNLIALLATRHIGQPIQSLKDLVDDPSKTLLMEKDTVFSSFVDRATSGILKEASDLRHEGRLLYLPNYEIPRAIEDLVRRGSHVLMIDVGRVNKIVADDFSTAGRCDFYVARESLLPFGCGIIAKKGNPIIPAINYRLGMVESSGLYQLWESWFMPNSTSCLNIPSKITVQEAFSLNSVWGMLVVLLTGLLLASVVFVLELFI